MEIRHHCNVPLSSCLKVKVKVFLTPEEEQKKPYTVDCSEVWLDMEMTVLLCSLRFQYIPENQVTQHPWMPVFVWQSNSSHPFSSSHLPGEAPPSACNALLTAHREASPFKGKEAWGALEMAHECNVPSLTS